jgi:hypothetical protein
MQQGGSEALFVSPEAEEVADPFYDCDEQRAANYKIEYIANAKGEPAKQPAPEDLIRVKYIGTVSGEKTDISWEPKENQAGQNGQQYEIYQFSFQVHAGKISVCLTIVSG